MATQMQQPMPDKPILRRILAGCLGLVVMLVTSPKVPAIPDFYWESPARLSTGVGAYPQAVSAGGRVVAIWQDIVGSSDGGNAWLSLATYLGDELVKRNRVIGPIAYRGDPPVLYSVAASQDGRMAIAVSSDTLTISIYQSSDGGLSFEAPVLIQMIEPGVAPRIFPRSGGGWHLFVTQGASDMLSIYHSLSTDGQTWTAFRPFVPTDSGLSLNFLPSAVSINGADMVVFQSLSGGDRPTFQLFSVSTRDGGNTWTAPRRLTDFLDPVLRDRRSADEFDNQRPFLASIGGRIWITWERRPVNGLSQAYVAELDSNGTAVPTSVERVSLGQGTCFEPRMINADGEPALIWYDNRRGGEQVYIAFRDGLLWREMDLSGRTRGDGTFGRAIYVNSGLYAFWQIGKGTAGVVYGLIPDTSVTTPTLVAVDFDPGAAARRDRATLRWNVPPDSSGILGFSYLWSRDPAAEPPDQVMILENVTRMTNTANEDGPWYFSVKAQDYAGNWSKPARMTFIRDTTAPGVVLPEAPPITADGFLAANSFSVNWLPPQDDDVVGYSWILEYLGPLDRPPARRRPAAAATPTVTATLPAQSADPALAGTALTAVASSQPQPAEAPAYNFTPVTAYERRIWMAREPTFPAPTIRSSQPRADFDNLDDGYWALSIAAIDHVGNMGDASRIMLRADKFIPYTIVNDLTTSRDDFGMIMLRIVGRGFADDGPIIRIAIDTDGREPYDRLYESAARDYTILSDRLISGLEIVDMPEGNYRIGLFHAQRGWYFTRPLLSMDVSGTIKFGDFGSPWQPAWVFAPGAGRLLSTGTMLMFLAIVFPLLGIVLTLRQAVAVVSEGYSIRLEAIALLEGKPMPKAQREQFVRKARRQRGSLLIKFAFTISLLAILIVALVAIPLGIQMLDTQSEVRARGLEQRVRVLLESAAQGGRSYLPARNVLELSLLPGQAAALDEALYLTITGFGSGAVANPDVVWASNDPGILEKLDASALVPGLSALNDVLSPRIPGIASSIDARARVEVTELAEAIQQLTDEGRVLATRLDAVSQTRLEQVAAGARDLERTLNQRLTAIADASVASEPAFDPAKLGLEAREFIFFKPILFRQGREDAYYRGMVRIAISTELIVAEVKAAREALIRNVAIIAAAALAIGVLGAVLLANAIIRPIRRLVEGIEKIRDTEDMKQLGEFRINLKTHDELTTLADTINEMTAGLVEAAKESEFLTVGKEVQKMFIPLETNSRGEKLTTGIDEQPSHTFYGYYEGAKGVSGDYFDYQNLNRIPPGQFERDISKDRYWAFIKCDVSGKGVPAALIMVGVATIFATEFQYWDPRNGIHLDAITYKINDFIEKRGFKGRFAAFLMGVYDARTGKAYLCHAGDNLLHIYKAASGKVIIQELPSAPAAGPMSNDMIEMTAPFRQVELPLDPGDILLLYTDGFEESSRKRRDRNFRVLRERKIEKDRLGNESAHDEDLVEQLESERIEAIVQAITSRGSYVLRKQDDPLGSDVVYEFDFSSLDGSAPDVVLGLAAVEKVFRMIPDPQAREDDAIIVDTKIDDFLSRTFRQYTRYCSDKRPHPDVNRKEYVFYHRMREDEQFDDLTMMVIQRKK
jgi:serine phosphatase RsbU (regulator of sigma subunit)